VLSTTTGIRQFLGQPIADTDLAADDGFAPYER